MKPETVMFQKQPSHRRPHVHPFTQTRASLSVTSEQQVYQQTQTANKSSRTYLHHSLTKHTSHRNPFGSTASGEDGEAVSVGSRNV